MSRDPRIKVTFRTISQPDNMEGDVEEDYSGWEDEEGYSCLPEEDEIADGITVVDKAAKFLCDEGVSETSSYPFGVGDWYSTEFSIDYATGEETAYSYHLEGFTDDEEEKIYARVFPEEIAKKKRHRIREIVSPHGLCARAGRCVEHEANVDVEACR